MHAPSEQVSPSAQTRPHPPQLLLSLRALTSQPLAGLSSQFRKPATQLNAHWPSTHDHLLLPTFVPPQRIPHPPQLSSSFIRSTSHGKLDEGHVADGSVHLVTGHIRTSAGTGAASAEASAGVNGAGGVGASRKTTASV